MSPDTDPIFLGTTPTSMVRMPSALRIVGDRGMLLVREIHAQAITWDTDVIDGDARLPYAQQVVRMCRDEGRDSRFVVIDLQDELHPPTGPAAVEVARAATTRGHTLIALVPLRDPEIGVSEGIVPADAPIVAMPTADVAVREATVRALVAPDQQVAVLEAWADDEALFVTADGQLAVSVLTSIPDPIQQEEAA